ncbi:MAG: hypothetical protein DLM70_11995 [Chloroflexi bacterium]|nr:MAG: hypothetical protein DLM70_11995 [Chloroflexota bacterium]
MEFAVDSGTHRLVAAGSCAYVGGFSVIDLRTGRPHVRVQVASPMALATPLAIQRAVCGERIAVGSGPLVVVRKSAGPRPMAREAGSLLFLNGNTGAVMHRVGTPAETSDVLVAR